MAFNLADALKGVPYQGTGREQIEYIPLHQIDEDPNNFYELSGLADLAANISFCGLQQPIRVRQKEGGRYIIVSGHRRKAAVEMLFDDDPERWKEVSCIVERDVVSPALQQLRLIYANANTRKMSPAEIGQQAAPGLDRVDKRLERGIEGIAINRGKRKPLHDDIRSRIWNLGEHQARLRVRLKQEMGEHGRAFGWRLPDFRRKVQHVTLGDYGHDDPVDVERGGSVDHDETLHVVAFCKVSNQFVEFHNSLVFCISG